jgi:hypothetical protein
MSRAESAKRQGGPVEPRGNVAMRARSRAGEVAVTQSPLTELELAMLEMVEFGVDLFGSAASRDVGLGLIERGLVTVREGVTEPGVLLQHYTITPKGAEVLAEVKAQRADVERWDNDHLPN